MAKHIDYDRGVIIRINPKLNMDVFMYVDDPGVYLNAAAKVVPQSIAMEAGFDIERWAKARKKKQAIHLFQKNLDETENLDEQASRKVIDTREGFALIELPMGRGCIRDPDGDNLVPPGPLEVVTKAFEEMFPKEQSEYDAEVEAALAKTKAVDPDAQLASPKTAAQLKRERAAQ